MPEFIVQMRCGVGEAERVLFSLESIAKWDRPCVIRILCESDAAARVFPERLGSHSITVVRVSRRGSWQEDHARLWRMGEGEQVVLMEPGILCEWSEVQRACAGFVRESRVAVVTPHLYWMFEEQAGEEQWHERVVSSHIVHAGVCWERGRFRVQQSVGQDGMRILGISPQLSFWRGEAFTTLMRLSRQEKREEIACLVPLWKNGWKALLSTASAFWLAGAYRRPPPALQYGYRESWVWRWRLRSVWKHMCATQSMVE